MLSDSTSNHFNKHLGNDFYAYQSHSLKGYSMHSHIKTYYEAEYSKGLENKCRPTYIKHTSVNILLWLRNTVVDVI